MEQALVKPAKSRASRPKLAVEPVNRIARNWGEWHALPAELRNKRDLKHDSLMLLWKNPLLLRMSAKDRRDLPELTMLASCDTFIFNEQILLLAYRAEQQKAAPIKQVSLDELKHIRAFRTYADGSPLSSAYFRVNGHGVRAGHLSKEKHPWLVAGLHKLIHRAPESVYLAFMLTECFTIEVAKTLLRDHGAASHDLGVQLHRLHLQDESTHVKVCLDKARDYYANLGALGRLRFWFDTLACVLLMNFASLGALGQAAHVMSERNKRARFFKLRFWLAGLGVGTVEKSCFEKAVKVFSNKIRPIFTDPIGRFFVRLLPA